MGEPDPGRSDRGAGSGTSTELPLGAEFETPSHEDWEQLVTDALRKIGSTPEDLVTSTYDGITVRPLYTAQDAAPPAGLPGFAPFVRGSRPEGHVSNGWDVRALHAHSDPKAGNEAVLTDLEGGVTSIWLRLGTGAVSPSELAEVLKDVSLDLAPVVLESGAEYRAAAQALLDLHAEWKVPPAEVRGNVGADPIGLRARTGEPHDVAPAAELAVQVAQQYPALRTIVADGLPFHEAGGSDAQELGGAVAAGVRYLRALTAAGLDVADAAAQIEFRLAATADQFLTIAKFRAARRLWARVLEVCGTAATGMHQHAVTSPAMLTRRDPWVNMLRTTLACFAAGVGGADAVTVLPFDSALGAPDRFSRRIARNTQAILLEESQLAAVIDPAGGSWYVENLTDALAHAAWQEFTGIEAAGGIEAELDSGAFAQRLDHTWQTRSQRLATRADAITGVSEFPLLEEGLLERASAPPPITGSNGLPRVRYAQDYERLRDRSDAHLAEHGIRPRVFLATIGPLAEHTARATFASNLFQAGGIEPLTPDSNADLVTAFRESGASMACLCGSDQAYAEHADKLAPALRAAGAEMVLLAGKPAEHDGVTGYVHTGCDALAVLSDILDTLGVAL